MHFEPCPFCGKSINAEMEIDPHDTLYPTGTCWRMTNHGKSYFSYREMKEGDQWCWQLLCNKSAGGCGAEMHGDSKEEVIANWNRRDHSQVQEDRN